MIKMMDTGDDFTGPVNLGNPCEFTILQLAETVLRLTNSKSKIVFQPLPSDDPTQRKPDITLAQSKLDWMPAIELEGRIKGNHRLFQKDFIKKRNGFTSLIRELRKPGQVKFYRFLTGGTSSLKTSIIRQEVFFIYRNSARTCLSPVFSISKLQKRHE